MPSQLDPILSFLRFLIFQDIKMNKVSLFILLVLLSSVVSAQVNLYDLFIEISTAQQSKAEHYPDYIPVERYKLMYPIPKDFKYNSWNDTIYIHEIYQDTGEYMYSVWNKSNGYTVQSSNDIIYHSNLKYINKLLGKTLFNLIKSWDVEKLKRYDKKTEKSSGVPYLTTTQIVIKNGMPYCEIVSYRKPHLDE